VAAKPQLGVELEPRQAGFDPGRLERLSRHFRRYVEDGRLSGWQLLISRRGRIVHHEKAGLRDREAGLPIEDGTLYRIYSMTKPVTSVAALMLWEEGAFELTTPVSRFVPAFKDTRVYVRGSATAPLTVPLQEPVRIWHLMTHTAGMTYGWLHQNAVDEMYRNAGFDLALKPELDLAAACDRWASLPLLFQPGSEWSYSHATDVLGRVIEVASGRTLDRFFAERIFQPLGMSDTAFWVPEDQHSRLAAIYAVAPGIDGRFRADALRDEVLRPPKLLRGDGGLVSTAADYHRFASMLLGRGEVDGVRLLAPRTVDYMTRNHLPGGADLATFGRPLYAETTFDGVGFGLGVSVVLDPVGMHALANRGEYGWGGLASTFFAVDPVDEIILVFMTQLVPSSTYPIRPELRQLVYQSLID
jgi:CubicO group peptidase (beta-lactamase class C family)